MLTGNYITNNTLQNINGGGAGLNAYTYKLLSNNFNMNYIGPVPIKTYFLEKVISKIKRVCGLKGNYFFFSEKVLSDLENQVGKLINCDVDFNFFFASTPWIKTKGHIPYFVYVDACFSTYVEVFNNRSEFARKDLLRIYEQESNFFKNAKKVFFRNRWALEETIENYKIPGNNFQVVGFGGGIEIPATDTYSGGKYFVFISKEFIPKGGPACVEAFNLIAEKFSDIELYIIGEKPAMKYLNHPRIKYLGFINKNSDQGRVHFSKVLSNAFAIIHPTIKDTNSLVITEAAYFGVPAITTNAFALGEFVIEGKTGYLVDLPIKASQIAQKMELMLISPANYFGMRRMVRENILSINTWELVEKRITKAIHASIV